LLLCHTSLNNQWLAPNIPTADIFHNYHHHHNNNNSSHGSSNRAVDNAEGESQVVG